jgi:hypothetical protein
MTRLPTRSRRRAFFSAVIAATVTLSSACGAAPTSSSDRDSLVPGASRPAVSVSVRAGTSSPPPAPSPSSDLSGGWLLCTNAHVGYSIRYPANWYTTSLGNEDVCSQFHPTSFTIPPFSERPLTALNVVPTSEQPAMPSDPRYARTLLWEDTSLGAHNAIRFEEEFTGEGLYEKGTMRYGYVTDPNGRALTVYTMAPPGTASYADYKVVVDQAVHTLDSR